MITESINLIMSAVSIFIGLLFVGLSMPLTQRKVKVNSWYGIRFQKSYESDQAWYDINAYGGRIMVYAGILMVLVGILSLFVNMESSTLVTLAIAFAPAAVGLVAAYLCWQYATGYSPKN